MCFYINERYCDTVVVWERIFTSDTELLCISLRRFYLPREFPQLFFSLVYIHPRADVTAACQLIKDVSNRLNALSPDAPKFILGDSNLCRINKTLRTYEQYVTCATTMRDSTIALCCGSVANAYRFIHMPFFGASYHSSVLLLPTDRPV